MMPPGLQQITEQIHASAHMLVLEFAGAGSQALFWLHSVPGSSRTILEATDRYAAASMEDLLGQAPEQAVSEATALAMASAAYQRARRLAAPGTRCLGVGCTAALVTDRVRRGEDRCWIAVRDQDSVRTYTLVMTKGLRDRPGEEALVSQLLLHAIAEACGVAPLPALDLHGDERVIASSAPMDDPIARLLEGQARTVTVAPDGSAAADQPVAGALLSASFNPLHAGHEQLAQVAAVILGQPVAFELPIVNADKPDLEYAELERRLDQFRGRASVVLSRARLFAEKAALYPGCTFVLGHDTAVRLVSPHYYGGEEGLRAALAAVRAHGCRFLVAGRVRDGAFRTLRDIALPPGFEDLFSAIPEHMFRSDLSSTAIRESSMSG